MDAAVLVYQLPERVIEATVSAMAQTPHLKLLTEAVPRRLVEPLTVPSQKWATALQLERNP
jgi:hypothetical protein